MADKSALALAMRRPKSSSPLVGSSRCTQEFEVGGPVPRAPLEVTRAERLGGEARGNDLGLVQVDGEPMRRKPSVRAMRKQRTAVPEPAQKHSSKRREQRSMPPGCEPSVAARASNGRVDVG